jgi:hypothetical protein
MLTDTPRRGSSSLAGLLEALEDIAEAHPETLDTDVRERIWDVVRHRIILADSGFIIPTDLGLSSEAANRKLSAALQHHLNNLATAFEVCGLKTERERLHSFQNPHVKTPVHGYSYEDFFGSP